MPSTNVPELPARVLASGFAYVESARWHDDRLWFAHWGTDEIVAVDLEGRHEVVGHGSGGLGWSIDWLPDGRMLVTGAGLDRHEPDGSVVPHADLSPIASDWNELVVDGRGNAYVNGGISFDPSAPPSGVIALVTPDGTARRVAQGLAFPNGMVITPDNRTLIVAESMAARLTAFDIEADGSLANRRVWADAIGADGICLDADGAVWAQSGPMENACVRVREGGEILARVELDRSPFACMLGGPKGATLFILAAEWRGFEQVEAVIADRTGQVLVAEAPSPHAGRP